MVAITKYKYDQMVSIHRPLGYGPNALPLRHSALVLDLVLVTRCYLTLGKIKSLAIVYRFAASIFRLLLLVSQIGDFRLSGVSAVYSSSHSVFPEGHHKLT